MFNVNGMKNDVLRLFADRWNKGEDVRKEVMRTCRYKGGVIGKIGLKDLMFLAHVVNQENEMTRAVHVMPVACNGILYEVFMFLDGTAPKGYVSVHLTSVVSAGRESTDDVGVVRMGWRDVQFKEVLGAFRLDDELRRVVAGVFVVDDDEDNYDGGKRLGKNGMTERGLPIYVVNNERDTV